MEYTKQSFSVGTNSCITEKPCKNRNVLCDKCLRKDKYDPISSPVQHEKD